MTDHFDWRGYCTQDILELIEQTRHKQEELAKLTDRLADLIAELPPEERLVALKGLLVKIVAHQVVG